MAIFKTNFEALPASEEEVESYYVSAAKKINLLLQKYDIRNVNGEFERVSADEFQALYSQDGFFQPTLLKNIFLDKKQQFIPQEIIHAFRSIISTLPLNIKALFFDTFITCLRNKGWDKPLSEYFEKHYNIPPDSIIILDELKDFSLGSGVYRATFFLTSLRDKVIVFLKHSYDLASYNELVYFYLQKELLSTASHAKLPYRLSNGENKEEILLSPLISGISSDVSLSLLMQAYKKAQNSHQKGSFKKALEVLIEAFISHAALGDLLGRNDRHLMNSLIASVVGGVPQTPLLEELIKPDKILAYAKNITKGMKSISLIDIDLKWLLGEKNADWALADIDFGLSELNLLSLLNEFNDYNLKTNPFFEKRKKYIDYYFHVYCQKQETLLENKELLFSAIRQIYPADISMQKLTLLSHKINLFEKSKEPVVKLFERYLLNFRIRLAHKATLNALARIAMKTNNLSLLNALKEADLLQYLPPLSTFATPVTSVFLQLQCFRGVLSEKDKLILAEDGRTTWEIVASHIDMIAEKFNSKLFKKLEDRKEFIKKDTAALLSY